MGCESVKDPKKRKQCEEANKQLKTHVAKERAESNFNNQNFEMLANQRAKREALNPTPKALKPLKEK
jgi:hypothetical protein